jgi:hypothetical protein
MTDFGKWSLPSMPHTGWTCVSTEDLGEPSEICEMCEHAEIRFVHAMSNPRWPQMLRCGYYCAGRMEEDFIGPAAREAALKKYIRGIIRDQDRRMKEQAWKEQEKKEAQAREKARQKLEEIAHTWIVAADEILMVGNLRDYERKFVKDMRSRFIRRPDFSPSEKQTNWFVALYRREVQRLKETAA